jgi:hypothetical protein
VHTSQTLAYRPNDVELSPALNATPDFDTCYRLDLGDYDPGCANGYSNMVTLTVPRPTVHYSIAVTDYSFLKRVSLRLTATPLGVVMPYKACYLTKAKAHRCVAGKLNGFSWNSAADDSLDISTRNLGPSTLFTWFVAGNAVAHRTLKT